MASQRAAPYLRGMSSRRDDPHWGDRNADFSRAEIRWLGALVIVAVIASAVAALVPDKMIADLLSDGSPPASHQNNAEG